jgi:hypothetical protein
MMHCYDEGTLRAWLDDELPADAHADLATHMAACAVCQQRAETLRAAGARAHALLATPAVDPSAALQRFRRSQTTWATDDRQSTIAHAAHTSSSITNRQSPTTHTRSNEMRTTFRRPVFAGLAALIVALSLLAFPPVRAAADQLLQVFRVQTVMFVPVDQARIKELQNLNIDRDALFLSKPTVDNQQPPRDVASAADASQAVGHAIAQPSQFPSQPTATTYKVDDAHHVQFQVNPATIRQVLAQMNITDVTIPDALGSGPISADIPAAATTMYKGANYQFVLHQVRSPNVTLPDGVDMAQLGKAALRLLGMDSFQAEAASRQINWNSTLVFPFPSDTSNIRQVTVNGAQGLLMTGGGRDQQHYQLYWQNGDQIYVMQASGNMSNQEMIDALLKAAESVR